jgi:hypothetical protein
VVRRSVTTAALQDLVQWGIGAWIGIHECLQRSDEPRLPVLVFAGVLMGVPAVLSLLHLKNAVEPTATVPPPSPPPTAPTAESRSPLQL